MEFLRVKGLLADESDKVLLDNITNDRLDRPYLIDAILRIIQDESNYSTVLTDDKILTLFRLCKEYFNNCFSVFLDVSMGGVRLDTLLGYSTSIIYRTDAPMGIRISTENEVKDGIMELIPDVTHNIDEKTEKLLYLLLWTISGRARYYKSAGLQCTFTDGRLNETEMQLIYRAGNLLRELVDWISEISEYERAIATLKLAKKNSKYSYPKYAKDEIRADNSIKQAEFLCKTRLFGKSLTDDQSEARKIVFKIEKNNYKPLPHEMALLRRVAKDLQENLSVNMENDDLPPDLLEICNRFDAAEEKGYIRSDDFAFKIISSIRRYKKCSPKQMAVLKRAEETIANNIKLEEKAASGNTDNSESDGAGELMDMYNIFNSQASLDDASGRPEEHEGGKQQSIMSGVLEI